MCYIKFKETNQICSPLKINQSINAESVCDGNNKTMYSCFYENKKFLSCLLYWEEKKAGDSENVSFKALAKIFLLTCFCAWCFVQIFDKVLKCLIYLGYCRTKHWKYSVYEKDAKTDINLVELTLAKLSRWENNF